MKNCIILLLSVFIGTISCAPVKKSTPIVQESSPPENMMRIHDVWAVSTMNGVDFFTKTTKRPILEFHIKENKFYGNDGCNQISGAIEVLTNSSLQLGAIMETKMACPEMKITNEYIKTVSQIRFYEIKELRLYLKNSKKKTVLTYKKID